MKYLIRYVNLVLLLIFSLSLALFSSLEVTSLSAINVYVGYPVKLIVDVLRSLSLTSELGNILAWILLIFICGLPSVFGWWMYQKDHHNRVLLYLLILFSISLIYLYYGLLNYWFIHPMFSSMVTEYLAVLYFIISILIFGSIGCIWVVYIMIHANNREQLLSSCQLILLLAAMVLTVSLGLSVADLIKPTDATSLLGLSLLLQGSKIIPETLMIILLIKLIQFTSLMHIDVFSVSLLPKLASIRRLSKAIVLLAIILPVINGFAQLGFIHHLHDVSIVIQFPWTELIISFTLLFICELLIQGIETSEENKQFI